MDIVVLYLAGNRMKPCTVRAQKIRRKRIGPKRPRAGYKYHAHFKVSDLPGDASMQMYSLCDVAVWRIDRKLNKKFDPSDYQWDEEWAVLQPQGSNTP